MTPKDETELISNITRGVLAYQHLEALIGSEQIQSNTPIENGQIQPNSLDLRLGAKAYRMRHSFLAINDSVKDLIQSLAIDTIPLATDQPAILDTGKVYLIPLEEQVKLPAHLHGMANPKSSTGRLDIFCRVLTEQGHQFDTLCKGYSGQLFLEVIPRSFPIGIRRGDRLAQLRIAQGDSKLSDTELIAEIKKQPLVLGPTGENLGPDDVSIEDGVFLSVDVVRGNGDCIGYVANRATPAVDLAKRNYPRDRYWSKVPIPTAADRPTGVVLHQHDFYIFSSRERVVIPKHLCAEMVPYDAKSGELRTHYAGFFDSGFGAIPEDGPQGARVVLEVRNLDMPFLLQNGQRLFRLQYHRNLEVPTQIYGQDMKSNYQSQDLKLAKQFQ